MYVLTLCNTKYSKVSLARFCHFVSMLYLWQNVWTALCKYSVNSTNYLPVWASDIMKMICSFYLSIFLQPISISRYSSLMLILSSSIMVCLTDPQVRLSPGTRYHHHVTLL